MLSIFTALLITALTSPAPAPIGAAVDTLSHCTRLDDRPCLLATAQLTRAGDEALRPLRRRIHRMAPAGQLLALSVVDGRHGRRATEALMAIAGDRRLSPAVRALAVDDLSTRAHRRLSARLLRALRDPAPVVRVAAARALSNRLYSGGGRLLAALLRATDDPVPAVRIEALFGCGFSGDPAAGPALTRALTDPQVDVRRAGAEGLAFVRYPAAIEPLIDTLAADDTLLVQAAARALTWQTGAELGADRDRWERWRRAHP